MQEVWGSNPVAAPPKSLGPKHPHTPPLGCKDALRVEGRAPGMTKKYIKEIVPFALFLVRVEEVTSVVTFGADFFVHRESVQVGAGGDPGADAKVGGDRQGLQDPATV